VVIISELHVTFHYYDVYNSDISFSHTFLSIPNKRQLFTLKCTCHNSVLTTVPILQHDKNKGTEKECDRFIVELVIWFLLAFLKKQYNSQYSVCMHIEKCDFLYEHEAICGNGKE
jgi:hypothetical protein